MRHRIYGKHLSRNKNSRTALFKGLVRSLLISESIETTESKAKAIKSLVDKLITQAKSATSKNLITQFLVDKAVSEKFIQQILPRLSDRTSGYTSITRLGRRLGDGTMVVKMSLLLESRAERLESSKTKDSKDSKTVQSVEKEETRSIAVEAKGKKKISTKKEKKAK